MIDFREIDDFEKFEDLCEELLLAKGLHVRRLGRGPGQLGKDIIAKESYVGSLSRKILRTWLVEVKFTMEKRSLNEGDIYNVSDRVKSQGATGYFLFTNGRLGVNLEKTLAGLDHQIDILMWNKNRIEKEILGKPQIFRNFFPTSYNKWIKKNRLFFLYQMKLCKSPLTCTLASLHLVKGLLDKPKSRKVIDDKLSKSIKLIRTLVDEMDEFEAKVNVE